MEAIRKKLQSMKLQKENAVDMYEITYSLDFFLAIIGISL